MTFDSTYYKSLAVTHYNNQSYNLSSKYFGIAVEAGDEEESNNDNNDNNDNNETSINFLPSKHFSLLPKLGILTDKRLAKYQALKSRFNNATKNEMEDDDDEEESDSDIDENNSTTSTTYSKHLSKLETSYP